MTKLWNITTEMDSVPNIKVFSGGACNILDEEGNLLRNEERDPINDWLSVNKIPFFDPQIHPDTHGMEYDYPKHSQMEIAARAAAALSLYEISPRTFGGITSLEIAADHFRWGEPVVIYFSDGDTHTDRIPDHSPIGHPLFIPYGVHRNIEDDNDIINEAHYHEMRKNANNMRKFLMHFAQLMPTLTATFGNQPGKDDIVIMPDRMHAADLFESVVRAATGERIFLYFSGGDEARDEKGNPRFTAPEHPQETQIHALIDQYIDAGNELRQRICELVNANVFTRVVYTQKSAIVALEELLAVDKTAKQKD